MKVMTDQTQQGVFALLTSKKMNDTAWQELNPFVQAIGGAVTVEEYAEKSGKTLVPKDDVALLDKLKIDNAQLKKDKAALEAEVSKVSNALQVHRLLETNGQGGPAVPSKDSEEANAAGDSPEV